MPSVAVLCEYPTLLGGERSWLATLPALRVADFTPVVLAPPAGPLADALKDKGVAHIPWSVHEASGRRRDLSSLRDELHALLDGRQVDLVHTNSLSMTRLAGPVIAERRLPALGHLRDIVRLSRAAVHDVNCMPRLLAVSEATRRFHVAQGIEADRAHVLYNGVDLEEFQTAGEQRREGLRDELSLSPQALLVVAIGQVGLRKGTDVFIELARCVLEQRRDVHFAIVGERTSTKEEAVRLEAALRAHAAEPACRGHIHFMGTREDVPAILAETDLVIHAARQEPLGRVLLEAAAAGRAIIATDVGGTAEIFPRQASAAIVVPPCEPQNVQGSPLLRATLQLLDDPERRENLGRAARRRAVDCFDARSAGEGLAQHYRRVLGS